MRNDFETSFALGKGIPLMQTQILLPVANVRCQSLLCSIRARLQPFWCFCGWLIHHARVKKSLPQSGRALPSSDCADPMADLHASACSLAFQADQAYSSLNILYSSGQEGCLLFNFHLNLQPLTPYYHLKLEFGKSLDLGLGRQWRPAVLALRDRHAINQVKYVNRGTPSVVQSLDE